jgi:hypothetical protein
MNLKEFGGFVNDLPTDTPVRDTPFGGLARGGAND